MSKKVHYRDGSSTQLQQEDPKRQKKSHSSEEEIVESPLQSFISNLERSSEIGELHRIQKIIGEYQSHVAEFGSFNQLISRKRFDEEESVQSKKTFLSKLSGYKEKYPNPQLGTTQWTRSYVLLNQPAQQVTLAAANACAVARRLLVLGRGNAKSDVTKTNGASYAHVSKQRRYYQPPVRNDLKLESIQIRVLRSIACQSGNCYEHANLAYLYLNSAHANLPKGTKVYRYEDNVEDHVFLMLEVPSQGSKKTTTLICDPWINFVGTLGMAKNVDKLVDYNSIYRTAYQKMALIVKGQYISKDRNKSGTGPAYKISQPEFNKKVNIFEIPTTEKHIGKVKPEWTRQKKQQRMQHGMQRRSSLYGNLPLQKTGDKAEVRRGAKLKM